MSAADHVPLFTQAAAAVLRPGAPQQVCHFGIPTRAIQRWLEVNGHEPIPAGEIVALLREVTPSFVLHGVLRLKGIRIDHRFMDEHHDHIINPNPKD